MSGIPDEVFSRLTFASFHPEQAVRARTDVAAIKGVCEAYAEQPAGWLVLMGPVGVGKSHLAYAIAGEALRRGTPVFAANVSAMLAMIRQGYGDGQQLTAEQRMERLRGVELLVMDDWGMERATDWADETLFGVLDTRYLTQRPTVVTTNLPLLALANKGDRLASRLTDRRLSQVLVLNAGDYRQVG
jgi:DNA replication protein DnaC